MRFVAATMMLLVAACQPAPVSYTLSPVSFRTQPVIKLNVAKINVVEEYTSPLRAPHVEHQMSMSPAAGIKIWANERVQAVGTTGQLDVVITDASIKENKLPVKDGVRGFFTDDQSERYDGAISVTLRLYDGTSAMSRAEGDVRVTRSRTINEKASLADREKLWHDMATQMVTSYDREAEMRFRQYFNSYIR